MKLFRRKNKKKGTEVKGNRSVVFIDREKKLSKQPVTKRGRIYHGRKFVSRIIISKKFLLIIVISSLLTVLIFVLLQFTTYNGSYISPIPSGFDAQPQGNETVLIIERELRKQNIMFQKIDSQNSQGYRVILTDNEEVLLSERKDIIEQLASLQFIRNRLTMEGRKFKRLDLRFEKPVITFKD